MKVTVHEAKDITGKRLTRWLELSMGNHVVNFRYENFVEEDEKDRIYDIITKTNDDESWKELLDIIRPHIKEIVSGAKEALENHDPSGEEELELGSSGFMVIQ